MPKHNPIIKAERDEAHILKNVYGYKRKRIVEIQARRRTRRLYILQQQVPFHGHDTLEREDCCPIRIGISSEVGVRLQRHGQASPFELVQIADVPCSQYEEKLIHTLLINEKSPFGSEWYRPTKVVRWFVYFLKERWVSNLVTMDADPSFIADLVASAQQMSGERPPNLYTDEYR